MQRLSALILEIFAKPDMVARLEELQTLRHKAPVMGNEYVQLINSQVETWRSVAKLTNVEVISQGLPGRPDRNGEAIELRPCIARQHRAGQRSRRLPIDRRGRRNVDRHRA